MIQFKIVEKSAPFGKYYKLRAIMPDGQTLETVGQKRTRAEWGKRIGQLNGLTSFNFTSTQENWKVIKGGSK